MTAPLHKTHPAIIKRLRFVEGHVHSIIEMMEQGRECGELAQQLHAVEKAIATAKRTLIHDHLDHCLDDTTASLPRNQRASIAEFKSLTKYL